MLLPPIKFASSIRLGASNARGCRRTTLWAAATPITNCAPTWRAALTRQASGRTGSARGSFARASATREKCVATVPERAVPARDDLSPSYVHVVADGRGSSPVRAPAALTRHDGRDQASRRLGLGIRLGTRLGIWNSMSRMRGSTDVTPCASSSRGSSARTGTSAERPWVRARRGPIQSGCES